MHETAFTGAMTCRAHVAQVAQMSEMCAAILARGSSKKALGGRSNRPQRPSSQTHPARRCPQRNRVAQPFSIDQPWKIKLGHERAVLDTLDSGVARRIAIASSTLLRLLLASNVFAASIAFFKARPRNWCGTRRQRSKRVVRIAEGRIRYRRPARQPWALARASTLSRCARQ
jgi:hypothetical protein